MRPVAEPVRFSSKEEKEQIPFCGEKQEKNNEIEEQEEIDDDDLRDHRTDFTQEIECIELDADDQEDVPQLQFQSPQTTATYEFGPILGSKIDYSPDLIEDVTDWPTYSISSHPSALKMVFRRSNKESILSLGEKLPTAVVKEESVFREESGVTEENAKEGNALLQEAIKLRKNKEPEVNRQLGVKNKGQGRSKKGNVRPQTTTMCVKGPKKQVERLKSGDGKSRNETENAASTWVWKPLISVDGRKSDTPKREKADKKAKKRHHKEIHVNVGALTLSALTLINRTKSTKVETYCKKRKPCKRGESFSEVPIEPQGIEKTSATLDDANDGSPPTVAKIYRDCGDSLNSNQLQSGNAMVPPEPTRAHVTVKNEPDQEVTSTASASTLAYFPADLSNKDKLKSTRTQPVSQSVVPTLPSAPQTSVWQGALRRAPGESAIPLVAYSLTSNATPHWFEDSGFRSKQAPFTRCLLMFKCTPQAEMFAFLQGDFQLAVVHFAVSSDASLREQFKANQIFQYLHEKKKVGACDRKKDGYLTHLFVYALGGAEQLPELLHSAIAQLDKRTDNMLLGLLVRKVSKTHPSAAIKRPAEKENSDDEIDILNSEIDAFIRQIK